MTKVKTIVETSSSALIEWFDAEGKIYRSIVPNHLVTEEGYCENPEQGLPYGIPFADFVTLEVTPEEIQFQLNNAGIWTYEDILTRSRETQGALVGAYGAVLGNLLANLQQAVESQQLTEERKEV